MTENRKHSCGIEFEIIQKFTSQMALDVDKAVSKLGLIRTDCNDNNGEFKCKMMRYEGIIDVNDETVYWNFEQ